jgi:purine-binding chemotaxis protein CheW
VREQRWDWEKIHERLAMINRRLEEHWSPGPEETRRILRTRAEDLARGNDGEASGDCFEVVEFLLGNEHYGLETSYVEDVFPFSDYTPLPGTPPFVFGLVNVRRRIVSVIDIKKFFGLPEKGITDLNKVVIIHNPVMRFGILADDVLAVRNIAADELGPPLPTLTGIRERYLKGVTAERLVVLDAPKLLADDSVIVYEEA